MTAMPLAAVPPVGSAPQLEATTSSYFIRGVTLIDGTGAPARPATSVTIERGVITAVESEETAVAPPGAVVVEGRGRCLIPGLFDAHVHLSKLGSESLALFVANGVTAVRDMGSDLEEVARWRREIEGRQRIGPRIRTSGPMLETEARIRQLLEERTVEPVHALRIGFDAPERALAIAEELKTRGADYLKVRTFASREALLALGDAARRVGLPLVGHAQGLSPEEILAAGLKSIEHFLYPTLDALEESERRSRFRRLGEAGVVLVPTLSTGWSSLFVPAWRALAVLEDATGTLDTRRRYVSGYLLRDWREQIEERRRTPQPDWDALTRSILRNDREMHQEGVTLLAGTDAAVALIYAGFSLHDELELMVQHLGMSPMEALLAATSRPAAFLGMLDEVGTVEAGKRADLVLLDADPLASISNTRRIAGVFAAAQFLDRQALDRLLAGAAAAAASAGDPDADSLAH